ncbi:MAG: ABC transporter permease [Eubacteriales bacterium]
MERLIIDGLAFALPLFIMAIGGIYCEKSGITNLALEGLQGMGAFFGALSVVCLKDFFPEQSLSLYFLALLFATLGGALYSLLHGLLCIKFQGNQVISGVVINILAVALSAFLTTYINKVVFGAPSNKFDLGVSPKFSVPVLSELPLVGAFFKDLYPFQIVIIFVAILAWYVLYHTKLGMDLRACGDNPHAIDAAGVNVARVRLVGVMVSGALSGLAGISFAYSISANFSSSIYVGYGYLSIAALIFGNWKILPCLFSCLLFGFAKSGGFYLMTLLQLDSSYLDLTMTLPYILTLLLLVFFSKYNRAPRALGEVYQKGKR